MLAVLLTLVGLPALGQEMTAPPDLQVQIIFTALGRDRSLEARVGSELTIGIVYSPSDPESVTATKQITDVLFQYQGKTAHKLPVRFFQVIYTGPQELERVIKSKEIDILYVTPGNGGHLAELVRVAEALKVTTVTGVTDYVRKGVALGVGKSQGQPRLYVNLRAAVSQGSQFEASLVKLAVVIK